MPLDNDVNWHGQFHVKIIVGILKENTAVFTWDETESGLFMLLCLAANFELLIQTV